MRQLQLIAPDTEYPLLKSFVQFKPTHRMRAPEPKAGAVQYIPRVMELSIGSPIVLEALVKAGWTVIEVLE